MAPALGLEPRTPWLTVKCSNQLSYEGVYKIKKEIAWQLPTLAQLNVLPSATEANNMAIKGIVDAYNAFGNKILVSELEHNSINACLSMLKDKGYQIDFIKTNSDGHISLDDLKTKLFFYHDKHS